MSFQRLEIETDPGFFELVIGGVSMKLDTYEQKSLLLDICDRHKDQPHQNLYQAIAQHLGTTFGIDPPSTALAAKYQSYVLDVAEDARKKLDGLPVSLSTIPESTPGSSAGANEQPSC